MKKFLLFTLLGVMSFACFSQKKHLSLSSRNQDTLLIADSGVVKVPIDSEIGAGKVVVVWFDGTIPLENKFRMSFNDEANQAVKMYGGWYGKNRTAYFVTSGAKRKYFLKIVPDRKFAGYTVKIKVVEKVGPYEKLDSKEQKSDLLNYLMSNNPEEFKPDVKCLGEKGYYLVRGLLQGNANIYWEHVNRLGFNAKFGVLLWNKDSKPINVTINSASARAWLEEQAWKNPMQGAMCGVWLDWFSDAFYNNEINNKLLQIPAYDSKNPSKSAKWIFMNTIPPYDDVQGTFNGLVNVSLTNVDKTLYTGTKLFCDTYVLSPDNEQKVLDNVANADISPVEPHLKGTGCGAILSARLPKMAISPDKPYRLLMGGFDPPMFNPNENVELFYYTKSGERKTTHTSYGYSNIYKFTVPSIKSDRTVKLKVRPSFNSNIDPWSGIYVVAKRARDGKLLNACMMAGQEMVVDDSVPLNEEVVYYILFSGMSSLPMEVEFSN